jgi:hypothetical protein
VGIPALLMAQNDYDRGVLNQTQSAKIASTAQALIAAIAPVVEDEAAVLMAEAEQAGSDIADPVATPVTQTTLVVAGGRGGLDDASAAMLGQACQAEGLNVTILPRKALNAGPVDFPETQAGTGARCLILCYLDPHPPRGGLLIIRRIKRADPALRVGVVFWDMPATLRDSVSTAAPTLRLAAPAIELAQEIGADFAVRTITQAMEAATRNEPAKPLPVPQTKKLRAPRRQQKAPALT